MTTTKATKTAKATTDYNQLWQQCLTMIREKYGEKYKHLYDVWFSQVKFGSYNPTANQLILQVPNKYIYEFLESYGLQDLRWVLQEKFPKGCKLGYHQAPYEPSFADIATYMQRMANNRGRDLRHVKIANAKEHLQEGLKTFLKEKPMKWLPGIEGYKCYGYDRVVEWLTDNHKRGLLCVGTPGTGKTLICEKILPILIGNGSPIKCVNATELHDRLEELKKEQVVVIDDLGKEPRKHYGDIDQSFFELCDNAEKTGNILIITTNLSTNSVDDPRYPDSIEHRYGKEVFSRLQAITNVAIFEGEDMR